MAKVLLVDDEIDILESVKMLIETMNHEVKTTDDGNEAIKMLEKEKFDLVLLDILMPKISGIATLEKIRGDKKKKKKKVVFLTVATLSQTGKEVVKKLHPDGYITKPIDNVVFKKNLKKLLGE